MYDSPYMTEYETDLHWTPDITPYGAPVCCDDGEVVQYGEMTAQLGEWLRC